MPTHIPVSMRIESGLLLKTGLLQTGLNALERAFTRKELSHVRERNLPSDPYT